MQVDQGLSSDTAPTLCGPPPARFALSPPDSLLTSPDYPGSLPPPEYLPELLARVAPLLVLYPQMEPIPAHRTYFSDMCGWMPVQSQDVDAAAEVAGLLAARFQGLPDPS